MRCINPLLIIYYYLFIQTETIIASDDFNKWRPNDFVVKHKHFTREFVLKLVLIFRSAIKAKDAPSHLRWKELVEQVEEEKQIDLKDVKLVNWNELRKTVNWWHKRYHENVKGNCEALWDNLCVDALRFWRARYLN